MALLAFYGSTSPSEFEAMEATETLAFARQIQKFVNAERELQITLAKFAAGARIQQREAEVR